jgi:hypothetical protein
MSNTTPEPTTPKDPKPGTDGHGKPTAQPTTTSEDK